MHKAMSLRSNGDAFGHRCLKLRQYPHVLRQLSSGLRQHRCRLLNYCCTPTLFCSSITNVRYDSTSTLEQGFPFFYTGSHCSPLRSCCRKAMCDLDTRPLSIYRAAYRLAQPLPGGQASPCVRPTHGQDGSCSHVVPLPSESKAQHQSKTSLSVAVA